MRKKRRRSDRADAARHRLTTGLEPLEVRQLLSRNTYELFSVYTPSDLAIYNPQSGDPIRYSVRGSLHHDPSTTNPNLNNEGKIVSGKDRAGNEWTITVHGPGAVIVTDTTPNDGILDDAIDTIQLVGTDIHRTFVTGTVVGSFRIPTDSTTEFNRLIDTSGVNSVILNGFSLAQTVAPAADAPANQNTGIFLYGGVQTLQFHNIVAPIDTSFGDLPINIIIGDPSTPLPRRVQPSIKLDSIFNTVFDSTSNDVPASVPVTTPTVNIQVNGVLKSLDFISTTQATIDPALAYQFPTVATTGRTSVQALAVGHLNVRGAATNFTASRSAVPFQNGFSGLRSLRTARFHGPTDAVGLDVNGPIRSIRYDRGMGNPTGTFVGSNASGMGVPATSYGTPANKVGYPGNGYLGGQVTATRIDHIGIKPANLRLQTPTNPDFVQLYRQGSTAFFARPANAMTSSVIATSGNIGRAKIKGDLVNSEIKTGFHYNSFAAGLEGTRAASQVHRIDVQGNTLNSVVSATYRPYLNVYGTPYDVKGPGRIRGNFTGSTYTTGGITPLGNSGSGFYAQRKTGGYLPPPEAPKTHRGLLTRRG